MTKREKNRAILTICAVQNLDHFFMPMTESCSLFSYRFFYFRCSYLDRSWLFAKRFYGLLYTRTQNFVASWNWRNLSSVSVVLNVWFCLASESKGESIYLFSMCVQEWMFKHTFVSCMNYSCLVCICRMFLAFRCSFARSFIHSVVGVYFVSFLSHSSVVTLYLVCYAAIFRWMLSIKTCICLMTKWQLNVSRVDSVCLVVSICMYAVAVFTSHETKTKKNLTRI